MEVIILRLNRCGHAVFRLLYKDFRATQQLLIRKSMTCCMCMWMGVYLQWSAEDIWGCLNSVSATTTKWIVVLHYNNECGTLVFVAIFWKKISGLHKTQRIIDALSELPPCLNSRHSRANSIRLGTRLRVRRTPQCPHRPTVYIELHIMVSPVAVGTSYRRVLTSIIRTGCRRRL